MQEIQVQSLDQEDPMEKGMATHFRILTVQSRGQRSLWLQSMGSWRVGSN